MSIERRLEIPIGTDAIPVMRLKNRKTGDPVDLTTMTKIVIQFTAKDRSIVTFSNKTIPAVKATMEYAGVNYTAVTGGQTSNNIVLTFNGMQSIADVVDAWNLANPDNTVAHDAIDDTVLPDPGTVELEGGL